MVVVTSYRQKDMKILSMKSNVSDPAHIPVFYSMNKNQGAGSANGCLKSRHLKNLSISIKIASGNTTSLSTINRSSSGSVSGALSLIASHKKTVKTTEGSCGASPQACIVACVARRPVRASTELGCQNVFSRLSLSCLIRSSIV